MNDTTDTGGGGVGESEGIEKAKAHLAKWVHKSPFIDALIVAYEERIRALEDSNNFHKGVSRKLEAEVEKLREQHSTDIDTLIEVGREWDEMKAEVERLKGCIISWAECMDICEYKALAKEMRDALTGDKEE